MSSHNAAAISDDAREEDTNAIVTEQLAGIPELDNERVRGGLGVAMAPEALANNQDDKTCRICLEEAEELRNPLITPCKCIGSVRFIHMNCLREWLVSKKQS